MAAAQPRTLDYEPPGPTLAAFFESEAFARALIGPAYGGRKTCCVQDIHRRARERDFAAQTHWRWLVISPTRDEQDRGPVAALLRHIRGFYKDRHFFIRYTTASDPAQRILELLFCGLDDGGDRRRIQTAEATAVWLDNARNLPEAIYEDARGIATRSFPTFPAWKGVICSSRVPRSPGHWLLTRSAPKDDGSPGDLALFRQPGGRSAAAENIANLQLPPEQGGKGATFSYAALADSWSPDQVRTEIDAEIGASAQELQQESDRQAARDHFTKFINVIAADIVPALHHQLLIHTLERVARGEAKRVMFFLPPGSAKALALDTPLPTPTGWTTIGEIRVGDELFDEGGRRCRVIGKSPVWRDRPVYRVTTDCGDTIIADEDHEWLVCLDRKRPVFKIHKTKYLARRRRKRPMVTRPAALDLPPRSLPIDPYVLGLWLGDGRSDGGTISKGPDDLAWLAPEIERLGYQTTQRSKATNLGIRGIRGDLVELGLVNDPLHGVHGDKRIPPEYLRAGRRQRQELLQGLIDSDGTVGPTGQIVFTSTRAGLAAGVAELARSLGVKASVREARAKLYGIDHGPCWRVSFYLEDGARLPRKARKTRNGVRTPNTYLTVEPCGRADTVCISVDSPSQLFLAGVSMTPTHNSTYASTFFPPWYMGKFPGRAVILASHQKELAERFGRRVRNTVSSPAFRDIFGFGLSPDSGAAGRWETQKGGEFFAAGVDSGVTGRRADLAIIDDPVKGRAEADSPSVRESAWQWYKNDFWTRLKPEGSILLIMTRWHDDDLAGRLIEEAKHGGEQWEIISLPAIAKEGDLLGRSPGERLWPDWFTAEQFRQAQLDQRAWSALYQQEPMPETGDYFKAEWIHYYDRMPPLAQMKTYGASDYAVTADGGDFTVHIVAGVDPNDDIYLLDLVRKQASPDVWVEDLLDLMERWKPLEWAEEQGQIEKSVGPLIFKRAQERKIWHYRKQFSSVGDKAARAQPIRGRMAMGRVLLPRGAPWVSDFVGELLRFPAGRHDDQIDAFALIGRMLGHLVHGTRPAPGRQPIRGLEALTMDDIWNLAGPGKKYGPPKPPRPGQSARI